MSDYPSHIHLFLRCLIVVTLLAACGSTDIASELDSSPEEILLVDNPSVKILRTDSTSLRIIDKRTPSALEFKINLPVERMALSSLSHSSYLQLLRAPEVIRAVTWKSYASSPWLIDLFEEQRVDELVQGTQLDLELLLASEAEVLIHDGTNVDAAMLQDKGVAVVPFMDHLESDPLGRGEWLRIMGVLLQKEEEANQAIEHIRSNYLDVKALASKGHSSRVIIGSIYQGGFSAAEGSSYLAQLVEDAGGEYALNSEGIGSRLLDIEELFQILPELDALGIIASEAWTRSEVVDLLDPRLRELLPGEAQVFLCNTAESDYFGKGTLEPHLQLTDIHAILTGQEHMYTYFKPVH